MLYEANIDNLP